MKKSILLLVTALLLTGLAGCSMSKNRYNHYGVVKYLENKYDDKFEYYKTYGGTLFDSDPWKGFICTSEKYPGKHILVIYDVKYKKYHDNYLDIKYARQVDELFDSMLSEVFGENTYCFPHYEDEDIDGRVSEFDGDTTFEQYIAMKRLFLYSFVKSDKSNEEIEHEMKEQLLNNGIWCYEINLYFDEDLDENTLDYFAYRNDVIRKGKKSRHFYAKMKDNKTFTECYWEVD